MDADPVSDEPTYDGVSAEQVIEYLRAHPDFLDRHPELLAVLTPPEFQQGDRVVNMQQFMVERLRKQIDGLQDQMGDLIFSARDNQTVQAQIHAAVIRLLEAESLGGLLSVINDELAALFSLDTVRLCVEMDVAPFDESDYMGLKFLPTGSVEQLMQDQPVLLGNEPADLSMIFGPASDMVASYALLNLTFVHPQSHGLLAFGVRESEQFHAGQGTELLRFLGRIVELCVERVWDGD